MKSVCIVGPRESGKTTLVERLTTRLTDIGRVATVKHMDCEPDIDTSGKDTQRHRSAGAGETYGITEDGQWFATGESRSLGETLDELAVTYDYAIVEGYSNADLPTIAFGGRDHAGERLMSAPKADAVDEDAVIEAIETIEPYETLNSLIACAKRNADAESVGAIATFTGRVRAPENADDGPSGSVEIEPIEEVAERTVAEIRTELTAREDVFEVLFHYQTGFLEAEQEMVYVVVLAGHRDSAFSTIEDGIDRLANEIELIDTDVTIEDAFSRQE